MKQKITLVLLLACSSLAYAQNRNQKTYVQKVDSVLSTLNKQRMKTNILYDRVVSYANLRGFNKRGDTSNPKHFKQAWSELHRASYQVDFDSVQTLNDHYEFQGVYNQVDVGIIHVTFDRLDTTALENKKGVLTNKQDRNPFVQEDVFLLSPFKERVWGQTITYRFKKQFMLNKSKNPVRELSVDFGDGQNRQIISGGVLQLSETIVSYATSGTKQLTATATLTDGTQVTVQSSLSVTVPDSKSMSTMSTTQDRIITADVAFKGYNENTAIKGKAEVRIFFRTNGGNESSVLQKPVIVVDGFDPLDKRKIESSDPGHNPDDEPNLPSIYDLMAYPGDNNLVETLRQNGYDVIIVNMHPYTATENGQEIIGGGDYIERNAYTVAALIEDLNDELQQNNSNEQLVIIGPSMGGLITRYALAWMEKNSKPHNTRLWVSFDSPHHGANIPISIHQTLDFFGIDAGDESAAKTLNKELRSAAARQMLIEQLGHLNNTAPFRQQFLTNLQNNGIPDSNGFPTNLRKIALVNGSTLGIKNNTEGIRFLDVDAKVLGINVAKVNTNFLKPLGQSVKTFEGRVTDFEIVPILLIIRTLSVLNKTVHTINQNPRGSMDVMPGATFNTGEIMHTKFSEAFEDENLNYTWNTYIPTHSFIPTVSSLAFINPSFNWDSPLRRNLLCTNEIPFDNYFAPAENEAHITLTTNNVNWVLQEINENQQLPGVQLIADDLSGTQLLCNNQTTTYSFAECKAAGDAL